jgi:hypothetical protein
MATLKMTRGTTYTMGYTHRIDGVVAPLTGCTLYFTVKDKEWDDDGTDASAYIVKTLVDADFTDPANGYTILELTDQQTMYKNGTSERLDPKKKYWYDIRVKEANGKTSKRSEGNVLLDGSATNRNV